MKRYVTRSKAVDGLENLSSVASSALVRITGEDGPTDDEVDGFLDGLELGFAAAASSVKNDYYSPSGVIEGVMRCWAEHREALHERRHEAAEKLGKTLSKASE